MGRKKRKNRKNRISTWPNDKVWNRCIHTPDVMVLKEEERRKNKKKHKSHHKLRPKEVVSDEFDSLSYNGDPICPKCERQFESNSNTIPIILTDSPDNDCMWVYKCPHCSSLFT
jgi:hypothetical protein